MILKPGVTVHSGKEKFTGEIPDEKAATLGLIKKSEPKPEQKEQSK